MKLAYNSSARSSFTIYDLALRCTSTVVLVFSGIVHSIFSRLVISWSILQKLFFELRHFLFELLLPCSASPDEYVRSVDLSGYLKGQLDQLHFSLHYHLSTVYYKCGLRPYHCHHTPNTSLKLFIMYYMDLSGHKFLVDISH